VGVGVGLIVFHFAVPFLVLLFRDVKESGSALLWVALGVMVMQFVDVLWWVEPAFPHDDGPALFWLLDVAAGAALGGVWVWWFAGRLRRVSLEPVHGPNQCEPETDHG
jgi:peptidoglycan/LPS O-acetylase OafA/YrhL